MSDPHRSRASIVLLQSHQAVPTDLSQRYCWTIKHNVANVHSKDLFFLCSSNAAAVPRSSYHETWFHISILYRLCCCSNCCWDMEEWECCKYTGKNLRIPMLKWSITKPWNEWCNNNATRTKSNLLATGRDIWAFIIGRYLLLLLLLSLLFSFYYTTRNWARLNWNKSNQTTVNDGFVSFSLSFSCFLIIQKVDRFCFVITFATNIIDDCRYNQSSDIAIKCIAHWMIEYR